MLAIYAFARKKVQPFPYVISSVILFTFMYGIRLLDITVGVNTILNLICLIFLAVFFNKMDLFIVVKGAMFTTLVMLVSEAINVVFLQYVFKEKLDEIIKNPYQKSLAGIPGMLMFTAIVLFSYYFWVCKNRRGSANGTTGKQNS